MCPDTAVKVEEVMEIGFGLLLCPPALAYLRPVLDHFNIDDMVFRKDSRSRLMTEHRHRGRAMIARPTVQEPIFAAAPKHQKLRVPAGAVIAISFQALVDAYEALVFQLAFSLRYRTVILAAIFVKGPIIFSVVMFSCILFRPGPHHLILPLSSYRVPRH